MSDNYPIKIYVNKFQITNTFKIETDFYLENFNT